MLRSTYSRIKSICSVALVPRILRPDQCFLLSKFEKFTVAVQTKALKSTFTDDFNDGDSNKKKNDIEYVFGKELGRYIDPFKPDFEGSRGHVIQEMITENLTQMMSPHCSDKSSEESEKCKKLIAQAFGQECSKQENKSGPASEAEAPCGDIWSKISQKNLESSTDADCNTLNESQLQSVRNVDTSIKDGNTAIPTMLKMDMKENLLHNMAISGKNYDKSGTIKEKDATVLSPKESKKSENLLEDKKVNNNSILHAVTSKAIEEELKQRLEHLDEPSIVVNEKPNVEGFNATPKILGGKTLNDYTIDNNPKTDTGTNLASPSKYDDLAKQCLDTPVGQIDDTLLKEMERLGVPASPNITKNPEVINNSHTQMDLIKPSTNQTGVRSESIQIEANAAFSSNGDQRNINLIDDKSRSIISPRLEVKDAQRNKQSVDHPIYISNIHEYADNKAVSGSRILADSTKTLDDEKLKFDLTNQKGLLNYDVERLSETFFNRDRSFFKENQNQNKSPDEINKPAESSAPKSAPKDHAPKPTQAKLNMEEFSSPNVNASGYRAEDSHITEQGHEPANDSHYEPVYNYDNTDDSKLGMQSNEAAHLGPSNAFQSLLERNKLNREPVAWEQYDGAASSDILLDDKGSVLQERMRKAARRHLRAIAQGLGVGLEDKTFMKSRGKTYMWRTRKTQKPKNKVSEGDQLLLDNRRFTDDMYSDNSDSATNLGRDEIVTTRTKNPDVLINGEVTGKMSLLNLDREEFVSKLSDFLGPLPNLSNDMSLGELLEKVRTRNQILQAKKALEMLLSQVEPTTAKFNRRGSRCPDTAARSYPLNPITSLPTGLRRPQACVRRKGPLRDNFSSLKSLTPNFNAEFILESNEKEDELIKEINALHDEHKASLTLEIIEKLKNIGKHLKTNVDKKIDILGGLLKRNDENLVLVSKNYEPWTPIPSYPTPKKGDKQKLQCPKDGCKIPPPRLIKDSPCPQFPCASFPKKHFSVIDFTSEGANNEKKVYDIGEF